MAKYSFKDSEHIRQKFREENEIYKYETNSSKETFSIDTPPPTISGSLHIGHIFSYSQAELIARYKRMCGYNVYYPIGFDDNGLPTETLAEKELGINTRTTQRKEFINKCLDLTEKYRNKYKSLWQSLGMSFDRSKSYSTISKPIQKIAQERFIKLLNDGLIIKEEFPALRCTKHQTTLAQAETEHIETPSQFFYITFTTPSGEEIPIATTRPELLPACVAVLVHPDDTRYNHLIGHEAITAIGDRVPILGEEGINQEKGSGAVMCCSYGDEMDTYRILKNSLQPKLIVSRYGKIENTSIEEINGLTTEKARHILTQMLFDDNKIIKVEDFIQQKVYSERGKVPIEIIPVPQWFVKIVDKKEIRSKQFDEMKRYPEYMKKMGHNRVNGLSRDWNISRNRTYGIPIPVRYSKKTGEIILPNIDQLPIDPTSDAPARLPVGHTIDDIEAESLVFDTWFISGLSPDINQYLLSKDSIDESLIPFDLRPQAKEIIRTWTFYTTIHSYFEHATKPFSDIMISGHVLAKKGEKISKSKGNAKYAPEDLIKNFGADAIRYRALSGQLGKDMVFDEKVIRNGTKLVNKVRNVFQYIGMQLQDYTPPPQNAQISLFKTDQFLLNRLSSTISKMRSQLDVYEYGHAKITFEEFFWQDFCDFYLEISKLRLYKSELFEDGEHLRLSAQYTLYYAFFGIIKLIAPYLPHITEEIYQTYFRKFENETSIHISDYPAPKDTGSESETIIEHIKYILAEVRSYKTHHQISLGKELEAITISGSDKDIAGLHTVEADIIGGTRAKKILYLQEDLKEERITISISNIA